MEVPEGMEKWPVIINLADLSVSSWSLKHRDPGGNVFKALLERDFKLRRGSYRNVEKYARDRGQDDVANEIVIAMNKRVGEENDERNIKNAKTDLWRSAPRKLLYRIEEYLRDRGRDDAANDLTISKKSEIKAKAGRWRNFQTPLFSVLFTVIVIITLYIGGSVRWILVSPGGSINALGGWVVVISLWFAIYGAGRLVFKYFAIRFLIEYLRDCGSDDAANEIDAAKELNSEVKASLGQSFRALLYSVPPSALAAIIFFVGGGARWASSSLNASITGFGWGNVVLGTLLVICIAGAGLFKYFASRLRIVIRNITWGPIYGSLLGYGTSPLPLSIVILGVWVAALPIYWAKENFEPSLAAQSVFMDKDKERNLHHRSPSISEWEGMKPLFVSLRYHLPVVALGTEDNWSLRKTQPLHYNLLFDLQPQVTPEEVGASILLLNWIMWPLLLTFLLRKAIRNA